MNKSIGFWLLAVPFLAAWTPVHADATCRSHATDLTTTQSDADQEFESIRQDFQSSIRTKNKIDTKKVNLLLHTIKEDGSWPDINYIDVSRKGFRHVQHLNNLRMLAAAYAVDGQPFYHNGKVKQTFDSALNYWLSHDFKAENWWHNEFGTPKAMKDLLLMMDDALTAVQRAKMLEIAGRANSNAPGARASGDRISIIGIEAEVALFARDTDKFRQCIERIAKEVRFGASDGSNKCLQHDFSFHHRKDRVDNTLSYGLQYANDLALWMDKVTGTQYEFPAASVKLLIDYYLDGICKHMVYGMYDDTGHMNRDISRQKAFAPAGVSTPQRLMHASSYRKDELQAIIDLRQRKSSVHKEYAKFFWQSEYLTVQRKDFFTSVRMFSTRNMNMEIAYNGEGLKNHYRGDGTNYLTLRGNEYHALPPVYDWMRIPGTTSLITTQMLPHKEIQKAGKMDFVGAVTDGYYASVAFDFISSHHPLSAKKSWFFFDDEYLCLGSDIHSVGEDEVTTTLNQTSLYGPVTTNKGILKEGEHHLEDIQWVSHDHVTYIFPYRQQVYLNNQAVSGRWSDITSQTSASKEMMTEKVMKLWIKHGNACKKGKYAYIVAINKNKKEIKNYAKGKTLKVLANTDAIQAAEKPDAGIAFAHFYRPGKLTFHGDNILEMEGKGLIMVRYNQNGKVLSVTVSDPSRKLADIIFKLNNKSYRIHLKAGVQAGSSETIIIEE